MMGIRAKANVLRRSVAAFSASVGMIGAGFFTATPAYADDQGWACQVALCASNPGGWMEFAECVPPIEKLITQLAWGGSFPVCVGGGFSGASYRSLRNGAGIVTFTMTDGTKKTYRVPTQSQIYISPGYKAMMAQQYAARQAQQ